MFLVCTQFHSVKFLVWEHQSAFLSPWRLSPSTTRAAMLQVQCLIWTSLDGWIFRFEKGLFNLIQNSKYFFLAWTFISNKNAVPFAPCTIFTESHGDTYLHFISPIKSCLFICNNLFIVWINRILVGILNFPPIQTRKDVWESNFHAHTGLLFFVNGRRKVYWTLEDKTIFLEGKIKTVGMK